MVVKISKKLKIKSLLLAPHSLLPAHVLAFPSRWLAGKIYLEYCAPEIPYYLEAGKYHELKYRLDSSELRMEFYLDLLFDFCRPGN